MKRCGLMIGLFLLISAVVLWADNSEMAQVLDEMTSTMSNYADLVERAVTTEDYIQANYVLAAAMEKLGKQLSKIYLDHGSWFQDPPSGLERTMERHIEIQKRYEEALQKAVKYANEHLEDKTYQESFQRLNTAIYSMYE